jgi:hypothetical protein
MNLVEPLYERDPGNPTGPFYVVKDSCITCSLPVEIAPENIRCHQRPYTTNPQSIDEHCVVIRQPQTPEELDAMIDVVAGVMRLGLPLLRHRSRHHSSFD